MEHPCADAAPTIINLNGEDVVRPPPTPDGRPATRDGRLAPKPCADHAQTMRGATVCEPLAPPLAARGGRAIPSPQVPD